jgi:predicted nucleic acid-binding protein
VKLIDTSAWVEYLRGPHHPIHLEVKTLLEKREAAWCGIVALELANYVSARQQTKLAKVHEVAWMLETDTFVWQKACHLATAARDAGVTAPLADLVVFTCSKIYNLPIVHKGDTDFDRLETVYSSLSQ